MYPLKKSTLSFPDRAPIKVRVDVKVKATPRQVWDVLMDQPGWVEWYHGMVSCVVTSPPEKNGRVGFTRKVSVSGMVAEEEFIALVPEKIWAFSVFEMNSPLGTKWVERIVLEPETDGGTRIVWEAGIEPRLLGRLFKSLVVKSMEDAWRNSLEGIDAYLEQKNKSS